MCPSRSHFEDFCIHRAVLYLDCTKLFCSLTSNHTSRRWSVGVKALRHTHIRMLCGRSASFTASSSGGKQHGPLKAMLALF